MRLYLPEPLVPLLGILPFVPFIVLLSMGLASGDYARGDVNSDGRVDVVDAQLILQAAAGIALLPTPIPTPTVLPTATATPTPVPSPAPGGDRSQLPLPPDFTVNYTGCTRNGPPECIPAGAIAYYSIGTHEAVMPVGSTPGSEVEQHETCHAHQDWTTTQAGVGFGEWKNTPEGRSFAEARVEETGLWGFFGSLEDMTPIELFAQMCAVWYMRPNDLYTNAPVEYTWFREHLP